MKTNFTFKLDSLKRINGNGASDRSLAERSTQEMLEFVQGQVAIINEFVDLTRVMSSDSKKVLEDCLTAINHIHLVLQELSTFFMNSKISDPFDITYHKVGQLKADAEKNVKKLRLYIHAM